MFLANLGAYVTPKWRRLRYAVRERVLSGSQRFDSQGVAHPDSYAATRVYTVKNGVTEFAADSYVLERGQVSSGNASSLELKDGDSLTVCRFLVPNQQVPPIAVRFESSLPFPYGIQGFWLRTESLMASQGAFEATYELWDWTAGKYDDAVTVPLGTDVRRIEVTPTKGYSRYLDATHNVRARALVRSVGPSAVSTWCVKFDQVVWQVANT